MTILHVAAGNGYGGIERMLVTFAATDHPRLSQRFVVAFGGRLERELVAAGATVDRLPSPRAARPLMVWRARRAFAAALERIAPAAAIFHGAWPHAMFAPAARAAGVRVGFWQHQPITRPAWPDRWARATRPHFVVFNSAFTAARPAFSRMPGVVIHPPVSPPPPLDPERRRAARTALGAGEDDIVILMAARLERWKGHEILLDAATRMSSRRRLRIWIAGGVQQPAEASYRERLAALAGQSRLDGMVTLLGEREDVPQLMRMADVYCQPNLRGEPFGIAIAEAMLAGLPCVVSAPGGAAELLGDAGGIVTAAGDAAAVAAALDRLAGDPAYRVELGRRAAAHSAGLTNPAGRLDQLGDVVAAYAA